MHQDIKQVIRTIRVSNKGVCVDFSATQHTPLGDMLYALYYKTELPDLVREYITGYPHNGGQHTLTWIGPARDAIEFIDLWQDEMRKYSWYGDRLQVLGELAFIQQELHAFRKQEKARQEGRETIYYMR